MKSWLKDNNIEMHNQRKYVVADIFITTLKIKIYKHMTLISRNLYIGKLDDIDNKCNNTYHKTIKIKFFDVNPSIYIDFNKENNQESPKFKIGYHVKISKYKIICAKGYFQNWSEEVFVIKKKEKHCCMDICYQLSKK